MTCWALQISHLSTERSLDEHNSHEVTLVLKWDALPRTDASLYSVCEGFDGPRIYDDVIAGAVASVANLISYECSGATSFWFPGTGEHFADRYDSSSSLLRVGIEFKQSWFEKRLTFISSPSWGVGHKNERFLCRLKKAKMINFFLR